MYPFHFLITNTGIELATMDIVAIARLRGPRLRRLDVSLSCLMHSVPDDDDDTDVAGMSYSVPFCHLREEEKYDFYVQVSQAKRCVAMNRHTHE